MNSTFMILMVFAPFVGSFLGVIIRRVPQNRAWALGRSTCDGCGRALTVREMIPVLSWLVQRRKCIGCGDRLSWFYPAIELAALVPVLWAATEIHDTLLIDTCVLGWALLALSVIDWRTHCLPDFLTLFVFLAGVLTVLWLDPAGLVDHAIGAAAGALVFLALSYGYHRTRGQDGLGLGDVKLVGGLGMWVAWQGLPSVIFIAALLGLGGLVLRRVVTGQSLRERIAFGPFLSLGAWIVWLYGPLNLAMA